MNDTKLRSTRILVDLQACQTVGSAHRGVGRYSVSLFKEMISLAPPREIYGILGAQHAIKPNLNYKNLLTAPSLPAIKAERSFLGGNQDEIDSLLHTAAASAISPDAIHVSHIFEGFSDRVAIPDVLSRPAGQVVSATLYDLIPLRFQDHYFKNEEFKKWYFQRLSFYHQADLLLAISEASRRDAIELLGIAPEKIVTIMGGISQNFRPVRDSSADKQRLRLAYQLHRPGVVLYTGGDDHRKNIAGAINAFALLPGELRAVNHLVIVCALEEHRKDYFESLSRKAGLCKEDIKFIGFIPEEDLVAFYGLCDVFFFPSLYEGLGFPVLEAMACGAPVLCGNNSSLIELINRRDATFDSASPKSIAERLESVLTDKGFNQSLRDYGIERSKEFTWSNTAKIAIEAIDEALSRKRKVAITTAFEGLLPKPRLAVLTPLPPCRSGIADYNAEFLPYLSRHFEIDLYVDGYKCADTKITSMFRIFDLTDFCRSASFYDAILYEIGNSEYHEHMLNLLEEFPGVVGLHDAFISGLMGYLEFNLGNSDRLKREMFYSHGSVARNLFAPVQESSEPIGKAIVGLPCTKRVIDRSIGIISHSKFNLQVAQSFYPEGWKAPYRVIPQMVKVKTRKSAVEIYQVKVELGFLSDDFIISTFGHVAWTKWGDRLLEAFLESDLAKDEKCHLVFAGELANDEFGSNLKSTIRKSSIKARVTITGYLSDDDYQKYISITDVAVQLRTKSRGGTPRGVLDCLAHGVPVIINNEASYADYPDDVIVKLPENPKPNEISRTILDLKISAEKRKEIGNLGYQYVSNYHNPENLAAQYAAAISEFIDRKQNSSDSYFVNKIAPHLSRLNDPVQAVSPVVSFLNNRCRSNFHKIRLIIDCSHIAKDDAATGIQRVVKETVRAAYCSKRDGFEAVAVQRIGGQLFPAVEWLNRQGLLLPYELKEVNRPIEFRVNDCLLMLDSSWHDYDEFAPIFAEARKASVSITTVIYDLLPISLPPGNFVPGGKEWFESWLQSAIDASDSLVCISKAVADDLIEYINENQRTRPGLMVGWWHLGAKPRLFSQQMLESHAIVQNDVPYTLMVGTIEPRKNHALALDAFEYLWWTEGSSLKLVIAGKPGWLVDNLMDRLRTHSEFGKRLIVLESVTDSELDWLYRNASMLLFISKGEGFGLPLVEAAQYNRPIVCSRIPSFIEIANDHAIFVDIESPSRLAIELSNAWHSISLGAAPDSGSMNKITWDESAENLLQVLIDGRWYWKN